MTQFGSDLLADSPELIQQYKRALEQNISAPEKLFACTVITFCTVPAVHDPDHYPITKIDWLIDQLMDDRVILINRQTDIDR